MIIYTPRVGRLITFEGICHDEDMPTFRDRAMSEMKERGAAQIIRNIIENCTTTERKEAMHATVFSIRAIVMSENEFKESVDRAYLHGMRDGRFK